MKKQATTNASQIYVCIYYCTCYQAPMVWQCLSCKLRLQIACFGAMIDKVQKMLHFVFVHIVRTKAIERQ